MSTAFWGRNRVGARTLISAKFENFFFHRGGGGPKTTFRNEE